MIATVRSLDSLTSITLKDLPKGDGSRLEILAVNTPADFNSLPAALAAKGIQQIDVVVANAGASSGHKPTFQTTAEEITADLEVNSVLPVRTFLSTWPLLQKAGPGAKFIIIGSILGSIGSMPNMNVPGVGYAMSKAATHLYGKKLALDFETHGLFVGILHPG